jgi:hypothetical protein
MSDLEIELASAKAEIERLNSRKEVVVPSMRSIDGNPLNGFTVERNLFVARTVEDVKAEAYKECIEKFAPLIDDSALDNLLEEMVGENDGIL